MTELRAGDFIYPAKYDRYKALE